METSPPGSPQLPDGPRPGGAATRPATRRAPFGRFLRGRGRISLQQLIEAVQWQRRQRPRVGSIALDRRLLSHAQVSRVLRARAPREPFLRAAVRLGFITADQARWILANQRLAHRRIGEYFVEHGILTEGELEALLAEHERGGSDGVTGP